jgi:DNA-binding MarR family transcriptional regulator
VPEPSTHLDSPGTPARAGSQEPTDAASHLGLITELCRSANILRAHLDNAVLRREGLHWAAYDVLQLVCHKRRIQPRTVAARVGVAKTTLSAIVAHLIIRGLIQREVNSDDRRRVILSPTDAGLDLARRIRALVDAEEQRLLRHTASTIGPQAAATLRQLADARHMDPPRGGDT